MTRHSLVTCLPTWSGGTAPCIWKTACTEPFGPRYSSAPCFMPEFLTWTQHRLINSSVTPTATRPGRVSGTVLSGGVSERPKEHASKACEGSSPPWVQIPPPPPWVASAQPEAGCWWPIFVMQRDLGGRREASDGSHRHRHGLVAYDTLCESSSRDV